MDQNDDDDDDDNDDDDSDHCVAEHSALFL